MLWRTHMVSALFQSSGSKNSNRPRGARSELAGLQERLPTTGSEQLSVLIARLGQQAGAEGTTALAKCTHLMRASSIGSSIAKVPQS